MRVVKKYQMPTGATAATMAKYLPSLWLEGTKTILFDVEAALVAVETDVAAVGEDAQFLMTVQEAVQKAELDELEERGLSFLITVQKAADRLLKEGLFPTYICVGDKKRFFQSLGLEEATSFLGIPVEEVADYPPTRGLIAGSKTKMAPILGITKSICFEVST
jgi:hypothetical protein